MKNEIRYLCSIGIITLLLSLVGCTLSDENISNNIIVSEIVSGENAVTTKNAYQITDIPSYTKSPYIEINNNVPFFEDSDLVATSYEEYASLDELGRCGVAVACVGKDIMPTEERGSIGSVKPTGWQTIKYDEVDGKYLYNRCHLIGYQLTAENANEKNLITGTRYMNVQGMLPFENMVADYIKETNNHVLYRVTPIFENDNLLASGVLIEAKSVEDFGEGIEFCVYCYNVQPGITINYLNGDSSKNESKDENIESEIQTKNEETTTYILNENTKIFHDTNCSSVKKMSEKNKKTYTGTKEEIIAKGYKACESCKP